MIEVPCLYCLKTIRVKKIKGVTYVTWPIMHDACLKCKGGEDLSITK